MRQIIKIVVLLLSSGETLNLQVSRDGRRVLVPPAGSIGPVRAAAVASGHRDRVGNDDAAGAELVSSR